MKVKALCSNIPNIHKELHKNRQAVLEEFSYVCDIQLYIKERCMINFNHHQPFKTLGIIIKKEYKN